jgi:hypothetical protein
MTKLTSEALDTSLGTGKALKQNKQTNKQTRTKPTNQPTRTEETIYFSFLEKVLFEIGLRHVDC